MMSNPASAIESCNGTTTNSLAPPASMRWRIASKSDSSGCAMSAVTQTTLTPFSVSQRVMVQLSSPPDAAKAMVLPFKVSTLIRIELAPQSADIKRRTDGYFVVAKSALMLHVQMYIIIVMDTQPIKGRGTADNPPNRFELIRYEPLDDGEVDERPAPATQFFRDATASIIATNDSPDVAFDASINPYRGCEHGCIYCYARPYHEYLGFSIGLDFETKIMVKEDAPALLRKELSAKKWTP